MPGGIIPKLMPIPGPIGNEPIGIIPGGPPLLPPPPPPLPRDEELPPPLPPPLPEGITPPGPMLIPSPSRMPLITSERIIPLNIAAIPGGMPGIPAGKLSSSGFAASPPSPPSPAAPSAAASSSWSSASASWLSDSPATLHKPVAASIDSRAKLRMPFLATLRSIGHRTYPSVDLIFRKQLLHHV